MDLIGERYRKIEKFGADSKNAYYRVIDQTDEKQYYLELTDVNSQVLSAKEIIDIQIKAKAHSEFQHPNAIPFYPPVIGSDGLILLQNDISGKSLNVLLKTNGHPLPEVQAYRTAYALTSALAAMHDQQIVHGELDSSHILISDMGETYISFLPLPDDFDKKLHLYRPPESKPGAEPSFSDDIYAIGVLLTEIFTSLIPFGVAEIKGERKNSHAIEYYKSGLSKLEGDSAEAIFPVILKCLTPDKKQRYESAVNLFTDVRKVVESWANEMPGQRMPVLPVIERPNEKKRETFEDKIKPSSNPQRAKPRTQKTRKKGSLLISFIAAIAVILGGVILFFYFSEAADQKTVSINYEETLTHLNHTQTSLASGQDSNTAEPGTIVPLNTKSAAIVPTETTKPEPTITPTSVPIKREAAAAVQWQADQSAMVYVPEGNFSMGMDDDFGFRLENLMPEHPVFLDSFWIDQYEVTLGQYDQCVDAGVCAASEASSPIVSNQETPVTGISWENAQAYCNWAGKRLPTEAEWEKAARGTDGRLYPWGNDSLQFSDQSSWYNANVQPVSMTDRDISPYGAVFMAGNVSEWVSDYFSGITTVAAETSNPVGPVSGAMRTVKGGSAADTDPETASFPFNRWGADPLRAHEYGFRCAASDSVVNESTASGSPEPVKVAGAVTAPSTAGCTNRIGFSEDVTIPDGTVVHAGEMITKTWRLRNIGTCVIGKNTKIVWTDTAVSNPQRLFDFNTEIQPGEEAEVSIVFPVVGSGKTKIDFQFAALDGVLFQLGERGRGAFWIEYDVQ